MGQTPFYRTSNELEHVHLLMIELEHPIFSFERSNIVQPIISLEERQERQNVVANTPRQTNKEDRRTRQT